MRGDWGEGLKCQSPRRCGSFRWAELDKRIEPDRDEPGALVWRWICPTCGGEIRREPFTFPPDMPAPRAAAPALEFLIPDTTIPISMERLEELEEFSEVSRRAVRDAFTNEAGVAGEA